ncbi:Sec14 cytosolic factor [Termitomyces sp. T112]|nr:Sec14 cytosolic factor [Termitomyces sp. T112]
MSGESEDHWQVQALEAFRKQVFNEGILHDGDSVGTDDETLLRFLRARKFDLLAAKKMLKDCQEWRKTVEGVGIDELYKAIDPFNYPERGAVFECWPMWFHKTDKKGRPLNIHYFSGMNLPKLYEVCTPERHWQSILVNAECLAREILPAATRKAGQPIGSVFVIVDLKGFGLSQFWQMKTLARKSFQISQDYFPETMGQLAIVNAPSIFPVIWGMIKPWISKETADKVDILGSDYKDVLLKLIDADCLPSSLGGTTLDGRPSWMGICKAEDIFQYFVENANRQFSSSHELNGKAFACDSRAQIKHCGHRKYNDRWSPVSGRSKVRGWYCDFLDSITIFCGTPISLADSLFKYVAGAGHWKVNILGT